MHELRRNLNLEVADVLPADAPQARSVHPSRPFVPLLLIALKNSIMGSGLFLCDRNVSGLRDVDVHNLQPRSVG